MDVKRELPSDVPQLMVLLFMPHIFRHGILYLCTLIIFRGSCKNEKRKLPLCELERRNGKRPVNATRMRRKNSKLSFSKKRTLGRKSSLLYVLS
jgi:hypothetical protein